MPLIWENYIQYTVLMKYGFSNTLSSFHKTDANIPMKIFDIEGLLYVYQKRTESVSSSCGSRK